MKSIKELPLLNPYRKSRSQPLCSARYFSLFCTSFLESLQTVDEEEVGLKPLQPALAMKRTKVSRHMSGNKDSLNIRFKRLWMNLSTLWETSLMISYVGPSISDTEFTLHAASAAKHSSQEKSWFIQTVSSTSWTGSTSNGEISKHTNSSHNSLITENSRSVITSVWGDWERAERS